MTNELQNVEEMEAMSQRMAQRAGINTVQYETIPTIKVYNPSDGVEDSDFTIGDFVSSKKTQDGWENEKVEKPINGVILKVRMFLRLKYKYSGIGKPQLLSNEFNSYSDNEYIVIKEKIKTPEGKTMFEPVFEGNYKQVNEKYSLRDDTTIEKKLDLYYAVYVLTDVESKSVVRFEFKGVSRSNFFDFMKKFTRRQGDYMTSYYTIFDSELSKTDMNGKLRKSPIAAITFTKGEFPGMVTMTKVEQIQIQFEEELGKRDSMFGNTRPVDIDKVEEAVQIESPKDELPTIQLEEEAQISMEESFVDEKDILKDIPF